jgi:hypothetical protein
VAAVAANSVYDFEMVLLWDESTTADLKLQVNMPSGAGGSITKGMVSNAATTSPAQAQFSPFDVNANVQMPGLGTTTANTQSAYFRGFVTTAGTAGNLQIQYAEFVADAAGALVIRPGSFIKLTKIA